MLQRCKENNKQKTTKLTFTPTFLAIASCDRDDTAENRAAVGANDIQVQSTRYKKRRLVKTS